MSHPHGPTIANLLNMKKTLIEMWSSVLLPQRDLNP